MYCIGGLASGPMARPQTKRKSPDREHPTHNLLIVACSKRKIPTTRPTSALEVYDGVNYRVLRHFLRSHGWPDNLRIVIVSAKYGLIDALNRIRLYDLRLEPERAAEMNKATLQRLRRSANESDPSSVFVNMGADYLPSIRGLERLFPHASIEYAEGRIGERLRRMKNWLLDLRSADRDGAD